MSARWDAPAFKPGDRIEGKGTQAHAKGLILEIQDHDYRIDWGGESFPTLHPVQTIDMFYQLERTFK